MQKPITVATAVLLLGLFTACKKGGITDDAASKADQAANEIVETRLPVLRPVSFSINNNIGGYQEALPARYDSTSKAYPLLLFIHGIGELGNGQSDLWMAANIGTPGLIKNKKFPASFSVQGKSYSFIVLAPQFKAWPSSQDVNALIDYALKKYRIDSSRIYLSGLSMGGGVTWEYAASYNKRLAAIVPICGAAGPTDQKAQKLVQGGIAVWAFHNEDDGTVSVNNSIGFVNRINNLSPSIPARLTLWPTGGHDAWTRATDLNYRENGLNMYEWMLQYQRPKS